MVSRNKESYIRTYTNNIIDKVRNSKENDSQNLQNLYIKLEEHLGKNHTETFKTIITIQEADIKTMNQNQISDLKNRLGDYLVNHSTKIAPEKTIISPPSSTPKFNKLQSLGRKI